MKIDVKYLIIFALIIAGYNFLVFFTAGFADHSGAFWASYIFQTLAFASAGVSAALISGKDSSGMKAFILGYPVVKWAIGYCGAELIISVVFMLLDKFVKAAVILQVILMIVFVTIMILSLKSKEIVEITEQRTAADTGNMQRIVSELDIICKGTMPEELKKTVKRLYEDAKYSDSVSSAATYGIESHIIARISELSCLCESGRVSEAVACAGDIKELLSQRNMICANNKQRY